MNVTNSLAARVIGGIIADGMNLSNVDLAESVRAEAVSALEEIRIAVQNPGADERARLAEVENVLERYNIK